MNKDLNFFLKVTESDTEFNLAGSNLRALMSVKQQPEFYFSSVHIRPPAALVMSHQSHHWFASITADYKTVATPPTVWPLLLKMTQNQKLESIL